MKEILLKFETEELFNRFIENIVIPKIENPTTTQLEFDFGVKENFELQSGEYLVYEKL